MQFGGNKKHREQRYPLRVHLYDKPPQEDIALEEFYKLAEKRLKVLQAMENVRLTQPDKQLRDIIVKEVNEQFPDWSPKGTTPTAEDSRRQDQFRREDHLSHYILLLAYCRTEELRRWFLTQETELFRYRLQHSISERREFLRHYRDELHFEEATTNELDGVARGYMSSKTSDNTLYKVEFSRALDLVRGRKTVVYKGYAYVPPVLLDSLLAGHFRARLSEALAVMSHQMGGVDEDDRLRPFLKGISHGYTGDDFTGSNIATGTVKLDQLDELSKESFPLCMRELHDRLRSEHHLRHGGRMQYGLFLKGVGLSLQQSLTFWKREFARKMDPDVFDKSYSYNIRHNYGKEGRRTNYTPYSCTRIITSNPPSANDYHGCPFRHWDVSSLRTRLQQVGLGHKGVMEVLNKVEGGHYQIACRLVFELTHPNYHGNLVVDHPNNYYIESRQYRVGGADHVIRCEQQQQQQSMDTTEQ